MLPHFGPVELILILVIVTMLFGVGKLPEVFGAVGKGVREFRKNSANDVENAANAAEAATKKVEADASEETTGENSQAG
jgi:sec-independent protein translocase protein TatA